MNFRTITLRNSSSYLARLKELNRNSWPEFIRHGEMPSWDKLYNTLSDSVLLLIGADDDLAGAGFTIPVYWNGDIGDLPDSIEAILINGLEAKQTFANTLMAVAALVDKRYQGQNLSSEILKQMKKLAREYNLSDLLVPVRPTWKARYPLQSIESYARWKRPDGLLYDPWLRTHQRLGATIVKCVASTLKVEGSIADWQIWTGMIFPETGPYIVPGALQPVTINVETDKGVYHDPNVWMRHEVTWDE